MKHSLLIFFSTAAATLVAVGGELPRVWMSTSFMKDLDVFEKAVKDCRAHGVDVMDNGPTPNAKVCAERLSICRANGMKLHLGVSDASKNEMLAKKTGRYELAVMSGGCYRGLAIDRNLFSFTAAKHEIIVEPPVYSKGQAYAKHPHYYMIGDGHYFGGYVPSGRAEVVVPERPFDGKQHLRIVPAKVETAPADAVPENDSASDILGTREIKARRLVKLTFDLTGCDGCMLDKVGLAVYWHMDAKDPKWKPERTCYSVFSPITRERMRGDVRAALAPWTEANGGKFPADVVIGLRLGDEIFNATGWLNCPAASFPLWDYSDSAIAAFRAASPEGVEYPRTWGAPEVYGPDACAQFLYLFHKACAEYVRGGVEEAHKASPQIITFRNTTRGDAWAYANDHDGTGQELLVAALDAINLDPYPVVKNGYASDNIPFDMNYLSGLARRHRKMLLPWMQAHEFPACGLVHPKPGDIKRMWRQMKPFAPDAIMWLGYNAAGKNMMTFPTGNPASWEKAKEVHSELKSMLKPERRRPALAIVRPYSARAIVCETEKGFVHPADVVLSRFAKAWSCDLGREYDVFEVPPYESEEAKAKRSAELKQYSLVVSSVDWPGAINVARGYDDKTLTYNDLRRLREEFRRRYEKPEPKAAAGDVSFSARDMPQRDVVVCGGGPAGCAAAIAARRSGLDVLLVEEQNRLGGTATSGGVSHWLGGRNDAGEWVVGGIFRELSLRAEKEGAAILPKHPEGKTYQPYAWLPWFIHGVVLDSDRMAMMLDGVMEDEGVEVLFETRVVGVEKTGARITHVIAHSKDGFRRIPAKVVIDATGDADVANFAGCPVFVGRDGDHLTTPASLTFHLSHVDGKALWDEIEKTREPKFRPLIEELKSKGEWPFPYDIFISVKGLAEDEVMINTMRLTEIDGTSAESRTKGYVRGRREAYQLLDILRKHFPGFKNAQMKSIAPMLGVRESRRIDGEFKLMVEDLRRGAKFPDTIGYSMYGWDLPDPKKPSVQPMVDETGGGFVDKAKKQLVTPIPYRVMVPRGCSNLLCPGRAISVERDVLGPLRVMAPCMAMGEACGVAAKQIVDGAANCKVDVSTMLAELRRRGCIVDKAALPVVRQRVDPATGDAHKEISHVRGRIAESEKYEHMHPRFAKAFEFMRRADLAELPCGRYEIDGSNCWAMVSEAALKPFAEENKYEVHRAFIDIQSPISGSETIGVAKPDPKVFDGFNTAKDYVLFKAKGEPWTLKPGEFAVFFPGKGAHAPGLSSDGVHTIRKLVIKVRK